jgi:hypothetical protein
MLARALLIHTPTHTHITQVQHYGGSLFKSLRETAEAVFVKLPPPKPETVPGLRGSGGFGARRYSGAAAGTSIGGFEPRFKAPVAPAAAPPPVDMSAYYNRGGGCFTAATLVTSSDGVHKRVDELQPGDVIQTFRKENNK